MHDVCIKKTNLVGEWVYFFSIDKYRKFSRVLRKPWCQLVAYIIFLVSYTNRHDLNVDIEILRSFSHQLYSILYGFLREVIQAISRKLYYNDIRRQLHISDRNPGGSTDFLRRKSPLRLSQPANYDCNFLIKIL